MADKEYIERGALLEHLKKTPRYFDVKFDVLEAPAADVAEVVHGKWDEDEYPFCNVCMECGLVIDRTCIKYNSGKLNYCPNCGAKMDGGAK